MATFGDNQMQLIKLRKANWPKNTSAVGFLLFVVVNTYINVFTYMHIFTYTESRTNKL